MVCLAVGRVRAAFPEGCPMSVLNFFERTLTDLDHVRLKNLMRRDLRERLSPSTAQQIEDTLDACAVVPARKVSPDVVTMYSQVLLLDRASGERRKVTLCYPADAQPADGFIWCCHRWAGVCSACAWGKWRAGPRPRAANARPRCWPSCSSPRRAATTRCSRARHRTAHARRHCAADATPVTPRARWRLPARGLLGTLQPI